MLYLVITLIIASFGNLESYSGKEIANKFLNLGKEVVGSRKGQLALATGSAITCGLILYKILNSKESEPSDNSDQQSPVSKEKPKKEKKKRKPNVVPARRTGKFKGDETGWTTVLPRKSKKNNASSDDADLDVDSQPDVNSSSATNASAKFDADAKHHGDGAAAAPKAREVSIFAGWNKPELAAAGQPANLAAGEDFDCPAQPASANGGSDSSDEMYGEYDEPLKPVNSGLDDADEAALGYHQRD